MTLDPDPGMMIDGGPPGSSSSSHPPGPGARGMPAPVPLFRREASLRKILEHPHAKLSERAAPVGVSGPSHEIARMLLFHLEETGALGLAAPQIGFSLRAVAIKDESGDADVLIDPVVERASAARQNALEGCLSLPGGLYVVRRPVWVDVSYRPFWGKNRVTRRFAGRDAFVAQHELDHLDGVLIRDHGVVKSERDGAPMGRRNPLSSGPRRSPHSALSTDGPGSQA